MRYTPEEASKVENIGKVLWAVYGRKSYPQIFACRLSLKGGGTPTIWGYSEWQHEPAFRTIGQDLTTWISTNSYKFVEFYDDHDEAIERIRKFTKIRKVKS